MKDLHNLNSTCIKFFTCLTGLLISGRYLYPDRVRYVLRTPSQACTYIIILNESHMKKRVKVEKKINCAKAGERWELLLKF